MTIIGIDPGKGGAISVYSNGINRAVKCPNSTAKMADIVSSIKNTHYIDGDGQCVAYIEQVHAFPTDARSAAFKFGVNYGEWLGILAAYKTLTIMVSPQRWQKYWKDKLGITFPKDKQERKRALKEIAMKYTNEKVTLYNADSILIAMYGVENVAEDLMKLEMEKK